MHVTQEVLKLRVTFLAYATDIVCCYVFDKPMGLQKDEQRAERWSETILNVARCTPFVKQFPWILDLALRIPVPVLEKLTPTMGGLARFHSVRTTLWRRI